MDQRSTHCSGTSVASHAFVFPYEEHVAYRELKLVALLAFHSTIRELFPELVVAPFVTIGMTDSRHFYKLTPNVYRFTPYQAKRTDVNRVHVRCTSGLCALSFAVSVIHLRRFPFHHRASMNA